MSLKIFHIIFITAAVLLALGCGIWGLGTYWSAGGRMLALLFGLGSLAACVALIAYERYVLKKLKKVDTV